MKNQSNLITVEINIDKPVQYVWQLWTSPAHIQHWNIPFDDWHSPKIENDFKEGGKFLYRMEAKDGSAGFDHTGNYDKIIPGQLVEYTLSDGRKSVIKFISEAEATLLVESFDPEKETSADVQREFCYSVLKKFKNYVEAR